MLHSSAVKELEPTLCSISPVHPGKLQLQPDGMETLKPNRIFHPPTTKKIPHLNDSVEANNDPKIWCGVGFMRSKGFFFGHYSSFYSPTGNPIDPDGWYYAYFVFAENKLHPFFHQHRCTDPRSGVTMI